MKYEISREIFKQRLENRLNFVFVDLQPTEIAQKILFKEVESMPYGDGFEGKFSQKFSDKNTNIILYSLTHGDKTPQKAADQLSELGYQFVYYYLGSEKDIVLDKGLN